MSWFDVAVVQRAEVGRLPGLWRGPWTPRCNASWPAGTIPCPSILPSPHRLGLEMEERFHVPARGN
jgi:hypothetical protein